jgi:hypothetical protein
MPHPTVDLKRIREKYHQAEDDGKKPDQPEHKSKKR